MDFDRISTISGTSTLLPVYAPRSRVPIVLPRTTNVIGSTEHTYTRHPSGNTLVLKFKSHASAPNSAPVFTDLSNVTGTVQLVAVEKSQIISVNVTIKCFQVKSVAHATGVTHGTPAASWIYDHDSKVLAESSRTLWARTPGHKEPLAAGQYSWNFLLSLSSTFTDSKKGDIYSIPPSFQHKDCPQQIQYQIEVVLSHKGYFSEDYCLVSRIRYLPRSAPEQPSALRLTAYAEGTPLPPPDFDPQGYKLHVSPLLTARIFSKRNVEVECSLALAQPTQYPRGYPIPFFINLTSSDTPTLNLLTSSQSIKVTLRRSFLIGKFDKQQTFDEELAGEGVCWLPVASEHVHDPTTRTLQGEIYFPEDVDPSFVAPIVALEYNIVVSIQAAGIVFSSKSPKVLSVPVSITMSPAPGPKPLSYAPVPGYAQL